MEVGIRYSEPIRKGTKNLPLPRYNTRTVQPAKSCYTESAKTVVFIYVPAPKHYEVFNVVHLDVLWIYSTVEALMMAPRKWNMQPCIQVYFNNNNNVLDWIILIPTEKYGCPGADPRCHAI
jgi:hypothetical protein